MSAPTPARCVGCGRLAGMGKPICAPCQRTLAHVCYGKARQYRSTARQIEARERALPGKENTTAYLCPVCDTWHTGGSSPAGRSTYADAVVICLKMWRFHSQFLDDLAWNWRPEAANRQAWREAVSPHRFKIEEVPGASADPCPATA